MIGWVLAKELRELWRDKRARAAAIIGPLFSVALTMFLFGIIGSSVEKAAKSPIHYVGASNVVLTTLEAAKFPTVRLNTVAEGERLIRDGKAKIVLSFPEEPTAAIAAGRAARFEARYDPGEQRSEIALASVQATVTALNGEILKGTLAKQGLDPAIATPLKLERKEIQVGEGKTNAFLLSIIPYLVVLWSFYGGFAMASDLVAGEKERQTLETLLVTPITRRAVALGKLLALVTLCVLSALVAVGTIGVIAALNLPITARVFEGGLGLTPLSILVSALVVVPLAAMFGALLLAISTFARNTREAQSYLAQASFIVLIPAVFSQIIGLTDAAGSRWVSFVPVLNVSNAIRSALMGRYDWSGIGITIAVSTVLAAVALVVAVRLFGREGVLTRI